MAKAFAKFADVTLVKLDLSRKRDQVKKATVNNGDWETLWDSNERCWITVKA